MSSWHKYKILALGDKIQQIKNGSFPIPVMGVLQLNYSCQQNCKSCAFTDWNKANYVPTKEQTFYIINQLFDYGVRTFEFCGGGEPLLVPYFEEVIRYLLSKGCDYSLITNGVGFTDSLIELVAQTASYCRVSLETGDRELYQEYKRVPAWHFDRVTENIGKLVAQKHPDTELSVKFDVDINLQGEKHIKDSYNLALRLGVDTAIFKGMTGWTEAEDTLKIEAEYQLKELMKDNKSKTTIVNSIYFDKTVPQCWLNPLHTLIDGYGDVYLCCYYYRPDAHTKENHCIGNVYKTPFKEIWESDNHWQKIKGIDKTQCPKFDCKFFNHHKIAEEVFKRGRLKII